MLATARRDLVEFGPGGRGPATPSAVSAEPALEGLHRCLTVAGADSCRPPSTVGQGAVVVRRQPQPELHQAHLIARAARCAGRCRARRCRPGRSALPARPAYEGIPGRLDPPHRRRSGPVFVWKAFTARSVAAPKLPSTVTVGQVWCQTPPGSDSQNCTCSTLVPVSAAAQGGAGPGAAGDCCVPSAVSPSLVSSARSLTLT